MSEISKLIGQRIRNYRTQQKLSQEKLAELSGCHPTYIGQVERGEKNATLESIEKIAVNTSMIKRGFKKLQSIPKTESLYFEVKSLLTSCFSKNFFSAYVSNIFSTHTI